MFKVVDLCGRIHDAYGVFLDENADIQFILCDNDGEFYKTDTLAGFYKLYKEDQ